MSTPNSLDVNIGDPNGNSLIDDTFPCMITPGTSDVTTEQLLGWVEAEKESLLEYATRHGAVLLRDFPINTVEDFDAVISHLGIENFPYKKSLSNAVRVNRTERVFSANEAPPDVQIHFHHEMAQTPIYPHWIFFYCEIAAEEGGATPICRSDWLLDRLEEDEPEFVSQCERLGLKYTNVMPGADDAQSGMGRSWQSTLGVNTREEAEARLAGLGYTWEWLDDNCLRATTPTLPAVYEVEPARRTFFNQLIAAYSGWKDERNDPSKAIRHGDGTPLDDKAVRRAIEIAEEITFDVPWKPGDTVLIDNRIVMHARRTFSGTRKIVASLGQIQVNVFEALGA